MWTCSHLLLMFLLENNAEKHRCAHHGKGDVLSLAKMSGSITVLNSLHLKSSVSGTALSSYTFVFILRSGIDAAKLR